MRFDEYVAARWAELSSDWIAARPRVVTNQGSRWPVA
jgi:hypothetical protein